jgi:hypothetical protein
MATRFGSFLRHGGRLAWGLIVLTLLVFVGSAFMLTNTAEARYRRDVSRMVFNDNVALLDEVRARAGLENDTLARLLEATPDVPPRNQSYVVVSIAENRLWLKQGDSVLFSAPVATGSGRTMVKGAGSGGGQWKFETPRGRLVVQRKDSAPAWIPPEWHFVEQARKRGLGVIRMSRGQSIRLADGSEVVIDGGDVVKRTADGRSIPMSATEGREIVVNGNIVIPPFGTNQRKYKDVLGTRRLDLGDGYGLHGTNDPSSVGRAVSHGCVRLRNQDIEQLYEMVGIGTPVYIY